MPTWRTKSNARDSGASVVITGEAYIIGEDEVNYVFLNEVPLLTSPSSVVVKQGLTTYVEVPGTPSASGQFRVFYTGSKAGAIQFNAVDNTKSITVDYKGVGSNLFARDINNLQAVAQAGDVAAPLVVPTSVSISRVALQTEETQRVLKLHTKLSDGSLRTLELPLDRDLRSYATAGVVSASTFSSADTAIGLQGALQLRPGTYDIEANVTINVPLLIDRGAVLRPANGVTVTVKGHVNAGPYKWMDTSLGGKFSFVGNSHVGEYTPQWWGIVGDGQVDDSGAWQAMLNSLPTRAAVRFPHQLIMRWDNPVTWTDGFGIRFLANTHPFDTTGNATDMGPKIIWGGAANAVMLTMNGCGYCAFEGFTFQTTLTWGATGGANVCIDMRQDMPPATRISTTNLFKRCAFWGGAGNTAAQLVRNSALDTTSNNEYHLFEECSFRGMDQNFGYLGVVGTTSVSIDVGVDATLVTCASAALDFSWIGKPIHIQNAHGGAVLGGRHDSTVSGMVGSPDPITGKYTQLRIATAATTTVTGVQAIVGDPSGTGYYQGAQNSHKIKFLRCQFLALNWACDVRAGSVDFDTCLWDDNRYDIVIGAGVVMPCSEKNSNCESSRAHILFNGGGFRYTLTDNCRFAFVAKMPNEGWIQCAVPVLLKMEGTSFDESPKPGESIFQFTNTGIASKLHLEGNSYGPAGSQNVTDTLLFGGNFETVCPNGALIQFLDALTDRSGQLGASFLARMIGPNSFTRFFDTNVLMNLPSGIDDAVLLNGDWYVKDGGLNGPRMLIHGKDAAGNVREMGLRPAGFSEVTGIYLQPDLTQYADYHFTANGAAPHIDYSLVGGKGDEFTIILQNGTAGAITTNWDGTYVFQSAWVDPAPGKMKFVRFKKIAIGTGNWQYELWRTPDITP